MLLSFFLYFSLKCDRPDSVPVMCFVDSWRSAWGIFRLFSCVEFAVLAGSDLLYSSSGNGEVRVCSCSMTLICHCQRLIWAMSWKRLSAPAADVVDEFTLLPYRLKLSFWKFSLLLTSKALCRGAFVLRPLLCCCTLWWQFCWVFLN